MARLNIKDVAGTRPFNICGVYMIELFDYKKYSLLEYNTILRDWFYGKPPQDTNIFKYVVHHCVRNVDTVLIKFHNNHWLKIDRDGWWCAAYCDETRDVISNRHFYTKNRTSETLGLGRVAYCRRPAKGITYKHIMINGLSIVRNEHTRVNLNIPYKYNFNVQLFKKYKEYQLQTHDGMSYFEKVNNKNKVLKTVIRVTDTTTKDTYGMSIEWDKSHKHVVMELHKNFTRETRFNMSFKDCDIDNIFNKYIMFEFDLTAEPKDFTVVEKVRTLLAVHLQNTYNNIKNEGLNADFIGQLLKRIEVLESDEHQVQKRP